MVTGLTGQFRGPKEKITLAACNLEKCPGASLGFTFGDRTSLANSRGKGPASHMLH